MVGLLDVFDQLIQTPLKFIERASERASELGREKGRKYGRTRCTEQERLEEMWEERAPGTNLCHRWPTQRGPEMRV